MLWKSVKDRNKRLIAIFIAILNIFEIGFWRPAF